MFYHLRVHQKLFSNFTQLWLVKLKSCCEKSLLYLETLSRSLDSQLMFAQTSFEKLSIRSVIAKQQSIWKNFAIDIKNKFIAQTLSVYFYFVFEVWTALHRRRLFKFHKFIWSYSLCSQPLGKRFQFWENEVMHFQAGNSFFHSSIF